MLKNAVIIIPDLSGEEQVCDFVRQTASILSSSNLVYLVNFNTHFSKSKKNLIQLKPFGLLPFRRFAITRKLNDQLYIFLLEFWIFLRFPFKKHYLWMFFPQLTHLSQFKFLSFQIIFDIVDFHYSANPIINKNLEFQKKFLIKKADFIFSISSSLKNLYQKNTSKKIYLVKQGFDHQSFTKKQEINLVLPKNKKIIGFIGQISERLDFSLLIELIRRNPQWLFVFIGPLHHEPNAAQHDDQLKLKNNLKKIISFNNVIYYEKEPRTKILSFIKKFDLCIIPYNSNYLFNRYCYPMKIFEYFFAGKPVVSSNIKELKKFPDFVKIAYSKEDWENVIKDILVKDWPITKQQEQRNIALNNNWHNKLNEISFVLESSKNE